jgi:hypothetical protein
MGNVTGERSAADVEAGDRARGWASEGWSGAGRQSRLLRCAERLAVGAGCQGRR